MKPASRYLTGCLLYALLTLSRRVPASASEYANWSRDVLSDHCNSNFVAMLEQRTRTNDVDATETLGFVFDRGCGVKPDMHHAAELFRTAVAHGDRSALAQAYIAYVDGKKPINSTASRLGAEAERTGDCFAPHFLASVEYAKVIRDLQEYRHQNELGAACGDVDTIADLTAQISDPGQAAQAIRKLLLLDTPEAEFDVGEIYYRTLHDNAAALPHLSRALSAGVLAAYTERTRLAMTSKDLKTLRANGVAWLTAGSQAVPNWRPQEYLGFLYTEGFGVDQKPSLGVKFLQVAVEQGDDVAMNSLGAIETFGRFGMPAKVEYGLKLLKQAADLGNVVAKQNLAAYRWNLANAQSSDNNASAPYGYSDATDPNSPAYRLLHQNYVTTPAPGSPADPNRGPE